MPDPAIDTMRSALERLAATVDDANPARIRESWQSPALVIQLACDEWDDIAAAVDAAREALAAAPAEPEWEWRACARDDGDLTADTSEPVTSETEAQFEAENVQANANPPYDQVWIEHRRKAGEWERVT